MMELTKRDMAWNDGVEALQFAIYKYLSDTISAEDMNAIDDIADSLKKKV